MRAFAGAVPFSVRATISRRRRDAAWTATPAHGLNPITIVWSPAAADRFDAARRFLAGRGPAAECLAVGESRGAVDDLAREVAARAGAVFGLHRVSVRQLAAQLAGPELARRGCAPGTGLNIEAIAARAAFEERRDGALGYLGEVARLRSFARTLAATLQALRCSGVDTARVAEAGGAGGELAALAARYEAQLAQARLVDAPGVLRTAAAAAGGGAGPPCGLPLLLLDVAIHDDAVRALVAALAARAPRVLATVPAGDRRTRAALERLPGARVEEPGPADPARSLDRIRRYLFTADAPPPPAAGPAGEAAGSAHTAAARDAGDVAFFSAPGEGRECVEIARRLLQESARGVRFDRMAVLVRAADVYAGHLETALSRAGVPAWFARGTRLPDPSGRAFLALLACAAEGLSARRFSEYLSLAQVPAPAAGGVPPAGPGSWTPPANADEVLPGPALPAQPSLFDAPRPEPAAPPDSDERPVVEGSLRAPWKWDRLLVESAVIGGLARWQRRLDGLARELALRREECAREDPDSPRLRAIDRDRRNLRHLMHFALPVIEHLAGLPDESPWAAWLEALEALAPRVLVHPERVLAVLAELRPMAQVGPVALGEVRDVLSERLTELRDDPPPRRYGQVFVGRPEQARGRVFDVIFVPGLAERVFPHKQRQDPLLLDEARRALNASAGDDALGLETQDDRARGERLLLQLAVGAARQRLCLSYPRLHASESRPRVPSFYALDIERARVGRVPDLEDLKRAADDSAGARLAWPAPADPAQAVDDTEHDLAVLGPLLRGAPGRAQGRARYLLKLNPGLHRSLVTRWARWKRPWSRYDGLYGLQPDSVAALAGYRPGQRPYSVSALQRFAACPYQFLLSAVLRLQPREESQPLERMDPLTRGRLFHEVQAELVRALRAREALPVTPPRLPAAEAVLDATLDEVAARYREELAPAIDRVWTDEVESMRTDLRGWLHHVADEGGEWTPLFAELGFGLPAGGGRDAASVPEPVRLDGKWLLRGVVDLIEAGAGPAAGAPLRVTDHKTGKNRHRRELVVGRGEVLQPVLYGLAVEQALRRPVETSRLFFCTLDGMFTTRPVQLGESQRRQGLEVIEVIDRALEAGALLPAPREGACRWCDFRPVCGPWEETRVGRKDPARLADLEALRRMP